jgi:High potential iron-sulfur protein
MTKSNRIWSTAFSRRSVLSGAGNAALYGATVTSATAKVSQSAVTYQQAPKGEQRCSNCKQFQPPNACKLIKGSISPQGWCQLWAKT